MRDHTVQLYEKIKTCWELTENELNHLVFVLPQFYNRNNVPHSIINRILA